MTRAVLMSTMGTVIGAIMAAAGAVYYGSKFHSVYWSNRDCFNAAGYCVYVDAGGEHHRVYSQAGIFFGVVAAICLVFAAALLLLARRTWHRYGAKTAEYPTGTAYRGDSFEITEQVGPAPLLRHQTRSPGPSEPD